MVAPGCVSEATEMECGRSEIDELIKEVSGGSVSGRPAPPEAARVRWRAAESGPIPNALPRHPGPRALARSGMGREDPPSSRGQPRPAGQPPAAYSLSFIPRAGAELPALHQ